MAKEKQAVNPMLTAYAKAHGQTVEKMLETDTVKWPGGKMAGFILWVSAVRHQWMTTQGRADLELMSAEEERSVLKYAEGVARRGPACAELCCVPPLATVRVEEAKKAKGRRV